MFKKQFIGERMWQVLIGVAAFHILAIFVRDTGFELPVLILVGLATLIVAYKSLPHGLMIAFAEIFVGGHGHLIDAEIFGFSVSLRIAIFGAVMLGWGILFLKKEAKPRFIQVRDVPWALIGLAVLIGTVVGFAQNEAGKAFDDMNGYLTILYLLPLISIKWDQKLRRELLQVLFGSAVWLVFFTLLLSFLFTHLDGKTLSHVYTFVRDSRLAEITLQTVATDSGVATNSFGASLIGTDGFWYRIFMQSQFYILVMLSIVFSGALMMWREQKLPEIVSIIFFTSIAAMLLSMSRSFFLGLAGAFGVIYLVAFFQGKKPVPNIIRRSILGVVLGALGFGVALSTIIFPFPATPDIQDASFYSTSADTEREVAVSSRWSLLTPMMDEIWQSPILGSGFGREVTYTSDDPRVRAAYEDGVVTTYRFEWGYQDMWMKMGFLGLLAFAWYAAVILAGVKFTAKKHGHAWLVFGLGGGIIILFISNVFSPYLNHPIGLAYMLFILPFIDFEGMQKKGQKEIEGAKESKKSKLKMSPAMTSQEEA